MCVFQKNWGSTNHYKIRGRKKKKMAYFREVKEKEASLQITKGKLYCNEFCFNISTLVEKKCCFLH